MKTTIKIEKLEISFESTEHPQQQGKAAEETSQRETAQASHNAKAEQNVNQEKKNRLV